MTAWRAARVGPGTAARVHDLREIVNAILYVCRTGIAWAYLPHDFPPYQTVYDYYAKWESDGTTEALHSLLREQVRAAKGRAATPTAAIIDSQSVKTSCNVSESSQGIDAGKKIKGRKRHIATDALGLLLVVGVGRTRYTGLLRVRAGLVVADPRQAGFCGLPRIGRVNGRRAGQNASVLVQAHTAPLVGTMSR